MTCVPYVQWTAANAACNAKSNPISVKGFGYVATGRAGLRNLGDLSITGSITPQSIINYASGGPLVSTAPPAPPVTQSTPTLNTTPIYDPSDPCYIAQQDPCPAGTGCPALCPNGFHSIDLVARPGQAAQCNCTRDRAPAPNYGNAFMARGTPNAAAPAATIPAGIQASASSTGGFQHWGLLAAVVIGGGALYYVTKKKKAA